jgi:hypothetical protein
MFRIVDHARASPQGDDCSRPSLQGGPIGRFRDFEILDSGQVFDDVLAGIVPHIDAMGEIGSGLHAGLSRIDPNSDSLLPTFGQDAGVRYGCGKGEAARGNYNGQSHD